MKERFSNHSSNTKTKNKKSRIHIFVQVSPWWLIIFQGGQKAKISLDRMKGREGNSITKKHLHREMGTTIRQTGCKDTGKLLYNYDYTWDCVIGFDIVFGVVQNLPLGQEVFCRKWILLIKHSLCDTARGIQSVQME